MYGPVSRRLELRRRMIEMNETPLSQLEASPGPWVGFNGVWTLASTPEALWLVRSRLLRRPAVIRVSRTALGRAASRDRRAMALGGGRVAIIKLEIKSRTRLFATKNLHEATRLVETLAVPGQ